MLSFNISSIEKAKTLSYICETYKDEIHVNLICKNQVIDGESLLGIISLIGNTVSLEVSYADEDEGRYKEFAEEIIENNR
jgi:phosphotransferase system HPr-like phosphotransfer protein